MLEVGALKSSIGLLASVFLIVLGHDQPFLDLLAVLQFTADRFVAGGYDFLPFGKPFDDLHVGIIANPDFDRDHFHMITLDNEHDFDRLGFLLFVAFSGVGPFG